jgi:hypothetical protein
VELFGACGANKVCSWLGFLILLDSKAGVRRKSSVVLVYRVLIAVCGLRCIKAGVSRYYLRAGKCKQTYISLSIAIRTCDVTERPAYARDL